MRLSKKNIKKVTEFIYNDHTYAYFVSVKSNNVSDSREYINYVNNKTTTDYYDFERLPKSIQDYITESIENKKYIYEDGEYYQGNHFKRVIYFP